MTEELTQVATFDNELSAEVPAGLLRSEGVPTKVRWISPLLGVVDDVRVYVPASLAHRARWFINSSKVTDAELDFAATGQLNSDDS